MIKSFFAPDSCLQGTEFPIHLIWDREKAVDIRMNFPSNLLKLKEIYNVRENEFNVKEDYLRITGFETNGYTGLVFKTGIFKEPSILAPLKIEIVTKEGQKQIIEHKMFLFRPHVVAGALPRETNLVLGKDRASLKNKISVRNMGKGTAVVRLDLAQESDGIVKMPNDIAEFVEKFCSTLATKAESIKKDFPEYSQIVDEFIYLMTDSVKGSSAITKEYVEKMRKTVDNIAEAFAESEDFLRDIFEAILSAYLSAVHIITEIHSFLEYLKSLAENRVLLLNATSVIELKPGLNNVLGYLRVQDLVHNVYEPQKIVLKVNVESKNNVSIPLYSMFDWGS